MQLDPADRDSFLDQACATDPDLRVEVEELMLSQQNTQAKPGLPGRPHLTDVIGQYLLIRKLGEGGMGTVYLAERHDEQYHKQVAIKVVKPGMNSEEVLSRFRQERQILAGLDHPNIGRLLDAGTTVDGLPYFVMEYVAGTPLDEYCDRNKLSIEARLRLFQVVCSAVHHAHQNLIAHRDLKPGNILVTEDGVPKLLDFGIAKLLVPEASHPGLTSDGLRVMTPEYASPEQVRGEPVTTATDVYSLGILLYQLLTSRLPFRITSQRLDELLHIVCEQEPEKPSVVVLRPVQDMAPGGISKPLTTESISQARGTTPHKLQKTLQGDLDHVVMMAIRKEPQFRYPSAEALSHDLDRHLSGVPVTARSGTIGYRAAKFIRRHKASVSAAGVFAVLILVFAVAMAIQSSRLARERDEAERQRDTAKKVSEFLVSLFRSSDPTESRGNTITAREILDHGSGKIEQELKDQPEVRATLMDTIGMVYMNLALYDKAAPLLQEAYSIRKQTLPPGHADLVVSMNHLAFLAHQRNDPGAEQLCRQALALSRKTFGENHIEVARSLIVLADTLSVVGKRLEAQGLYREALRIQQKILGPDSVDVAQTLVSLGNILGGPEPEPMYRQALPIFQKAHHPGEAGCRILLAEIEMNRGNFEEAQRMIEQSLALRKSFYGEENEKVVWTMNRLGKVFYEKGDYAASEDVFERTLAMRTKIWGAENTEVAYDMYYLATTLLAERKVARAEVLFRKSLELQRKLNPPGHPEIGRSCIGLGKLLLETGRPAEAVPLLTEAIEIEKKTESPDGVANATSALGGCYTALGKLQEAEPLLLKSYQVLKDGSGDYDSVTREAKLRLSRLYEAMNKPKEAALYRQP